MRRIAWLLIVISAAVGIALLMRGGDGNVAILWPPYRIDLSVNLAVLILVALFLLLHLFFGALSGALNLPGRVREYRERRQRDKALKGLRDSLLAFFEGRYGRAERLARGALADEALAGSAALIGARSAQRMGDVERRDRWIESAVQAPGVANARRMIEAEIALDERRPEDALAALEGLEPTRGGPHIQALRLALRAHEQRGDGAAVLEHIRQLERRHAIDEPLALVTRVRAIRSLLDGAGDDAEAVTRILGEIPAPERETEEVAQAAARALIRVGRHEPAARIVEQALHRRYDPELVALWPVLTGVPGRKRIAEAEGWLQRWGEQIALLLALGRLCAAEELWGKAEEFLMRAERKSPDPAVQALLGLLCDKLDRPDDATRWYRSASLLAFGAGEIPLLPSPAPRVRNQGDPDEDEGEPPLALPVPGP
jgi:HemY protein